MNTLRHQCSRASSVRIRTSTAPRASSASPVFGASPVLVCSGDGLLASEVVAPRRLIGRLVVRAQRGMPLGLSQSLVAKRVGISGREGGVQTLVGLASTVLFKCQKLVLARCGHFRISGGKAFSLLRFFVAVGQRNEVPPRTVANSAKENIQHITRSGLSSSNPASTPPPTNLNKQLP